VYGGIVDVHAVQLGTRRGDLLDAQLAQLGLQLAQLLEQILLVLGPEGTGLDLRSRLQKKGFVSDNHSSSVAVVGMSCEAAAAARIARAVGEDDDAECRRRLTILRILVWANVGTQEAVG
jgi:hypothetical protein